MAGYIPPNGMLIKQIHDRLEKNANNSLRPQGLTLMQVSVLIKLNEADNQQLSMKELERHFGVAQSTVAGIISRLEQKGFVEAMPDAEDRRVKLVHITGAGEKCCLDAAQDMSRTEELLLQGFSEEERSLIKHFLVKIANNLE